MPNHFPRISYQAKASIVNLVTFEQPTISLHFLRAHKHGIFDPKDRPEQIKDSLRNSNIVLHDALFGYLLILDVSL